MAADFFSNLLDWCPAGASSDLCSYMAGLPDTDPAGQCIEFAWTFGYASASARCSGLGVYGMELDLLLMEAANEGQVANNPPPSQHDLCEMAESAYIAGYLAKRGSPLTAADAMRIVQDSDARGLDDRFIVALAGVETTYGKDQRWGAFNAFNNGIRDFSDYGAAIDSVTYLLGTDPRYTPYNSTLNIYSVYERGNVNTRSGNQRLLDRIYGKQLGGNLANIRSPRCP